MVITRTGGTISVAGSVNPSGTQLVFTAPVHSVAETVTAVVYVNASVQSYDYATFTYSGVRCLLVIARAMQRDRLLTR